VGIPHRMGKIWDGKMGVFCDPLRGRLRTRQNERAMLCDPLRGRMPYPRAGCYYLRPRWGRKRMSIGGVGYYLRPASGSNAGSARGVLLSAPPLGSETHMPKRMGYVLRPAPGSNAGSARGVLLSAPPLGSETHMPKRMGYVLRPAPGSNAGSASGVLISATPLGSETTTAIRGTTLFCDHAGVERKCVWGVKIGEPSCGGSETRTRHN